MQVWASQLGWTDLVALSAVEDRLARHPGYRRRAALPEVVRVVDRATATLVEALLRADHAEQATGTAAPQAPPAALDALIVRADRARRHHYR